MTGFTSDEFQGWSSRFGLELDVAVGEAHQRLGRVERRNAVAREALGTYDADKSEGRLPSADAFREALCSSCTVERSPSRIRFRTFMAGSQHSNCISILSDSTFNAA